MGFPSLGEYFGSFGGQRPQNVNFRDFFAQKARVSSEPRRLMYNTPQGLQPRSKSWGCKIFQNVPPKDYSNPSRREFMFISKCTNKFGGRAPPGGPDPLRKFKHFSRHPSRNGCGRFAFKERKKSSPQIAFPLLHKSHSGHI